MSIGTHYSPFKQRHSERFLTRNLIPINEKFNTKKKALNENFNTFNEKRLLFSLKVHVFAPETKLERT